MSTGVSCTSPGHRKEVRGITRVGGTQRWLGDDETNGSPFQNINCCSSTDGATPASARTRSVAAGGSVGRAVTGGRNRLPRGGAERVVTAAPGEACDFSPRVGAGLSWWMSLPVDDLGRGRAATASVGVP
jgi:hypothetical protein